MDAQRFKRAATPKRLGSDTATAATRDVKRRGLTITTPDIWRPGWDAGSRVIPREFTKQQTSINLRGRIRFCLLTITGLKALAQCNARSFNIASAARKAPLNFTRLPGPTATNFQARHTGQARRGM